MNPEDRNRLVEEIADHIDYLGKVDMSRLRAMHPLCIAAKTTEQKETAKILNGRLRHTIIADVIRHRFKTKQA